MKTLVGAAIVAAAFAFAGPVAALPAVDFFAVSYDFDRAAARARDNGRDDWAHALATGFMPRPPAAANPPASDLSPA